MSCRLCGEERPLLKSHILPEFYYTPIYDKSHRLNLISSEPEKINRHSRKGFWERLLCESCEQRFSRWEGYAKTVFDGHGIGVKADGTTLIISNVDYCKFRLFLLSLLWRMSVSNGEFFVGVDLGTKHEAKIRRALLDEDPLEPSDYPCALIGVLIGGIFNRDIIMPPLAVRGTDHRGYSVLIGGLLYQYFVMSNPPPEFYTLFCLSKNNEMRIGIQEVRDIPFLNERIHEFGAAISSRRQKLH